MALEITKYIYLFKKVKYNDININIIQLYVIFKIIRIIKL